ncbi:hypothetical protein O181_050802 [Austropuccinia psidii MF-1]|uniref:Cytochrome c oxidase copper chaperone n=1 Tax=Austropuccinia psidii MF-1 TaxID=1389203 RepID=A0A9Q3DZP1_9BASI|nr:hypothetical protein [Austropuccinia psidii MF-1]
MRCSARLGGCFQEHHPKIFLPRISSYRQRYTSSINQNLLKTHFLKMWSLFKAPETRSYEDRIFHSQSNTVAKTDLKLQAKKQASTSSEDKPKPCCACPETRRIRDDCFLKYGPPDQSSESTLKCAELIAAHRNCMAQYGFQI